MRAHPRYLAPLILALGLAAGTANADIRTGLVGYYPLNEGAGTIAHDLSGQGHDGTLYNGVTWIATGYQGGAVNDDGKVDSRIQLGTWDPAAGTGQLSLALWIRWTGGGGTYQGLLGKRNTWPATTEFELQVRPANGGTFRFENSGTVFVVSPNNTLNPLIRTWAHVAATFDGTTARLYLNGKEIASGPFALNMAGVGSLMGIGSVTGGGAGYNGNNQTFLGDIDEVGIFNRALSAPEVAQVMVGYRGDQASNPCPEDKATDVPRDVVLGWDPVVTATTRDVYFGTVYADVDNASRAGPGKVLVSQGQTATTFAPAGLDYGRQYYWRVDEINAPPDGTVFRGNVWSFTSEPYAYPVTPIKATASSAQAGMEPERTMDGSGLNANDEHATDLMQMWVSSGLQPNWIQYEFDHVCKLHELWVWNANSPLEPVMGLGARVVKIEYSSDGQVWTELAGVPEFTQATGLPTYTHNTTVSFGGVLAQYVKLTITKSWGGATTQASLSEVRFFSVPVQARAPQPAEGATNVSTTTDLNWRPGREAQSHQVSFGTDAAAVAAGTVPAATRAEHRYTPAALELGTTYYWKVDEVGDTGTWAGNLWSFTTQAATIIEDFESYNDNMNAGTTVFQTWTDGLADNFQSSGSTVGLNEARDGTFCETTIFHGGRQSMPLQYNNAAAPFYSEARRAFAAPQNWRDRGANTLTLYLRGKAGLFQETPGGEMIMGAIGTDIWDTADQCQYAYKNLSGNGSMVVRVNSLIRSHGWAKAGVMIRESLHPGSKHVFVCLSPDYGVSFQQRPQTGNTMTQVATGTVVASSWVKLTRTGDVFTAQCSADGATWTNVTFTAPVNISMAGDVLIGLAVTSHDAAIPTAAEFSNLATTGNVTGAWQIAEIGVAQPQGNSLEPLYVRIEDSTGATATIVNADDAVTLRATWREWAIPYSDLVGVNLNRVKAMCIGVGNRQAPTAGGTGTVYVDDIALGRHSAP